MEALVEVAMNQNTYSQPI